ncbi:MAG: conserved membrane protein of unknown function [Candidatus Thorarchaeota archaeon]|nr:MAG: conserved membrane protein of unknown function [Candidatus Thorarchaeota archaeon]
MSEEPIVTRSQNPLWIAISIGFFSSMIVGGLSSIPIIEMGTIDLFTIFIFSFVVPLSVTILSFSIGWRLKKNAVQYVDPEDIRLDKIQLRIEDCKEFVKAYNQQHFSVAAVGRIWYYFVPVIQLCFNIGIPFYLYQINAAIVDYVSLIVALNFAILWTIGVYGGFRSTSNAGSETFTLPLIREAINLAQKQSKVYGVSKVRIVMDHAVIGSLRTYQNPRVVLHVDGIYKAGYIESVSEEMNSVARILTVLYESDEHPQIVWWWLSRDRNFRKYVGSEDDGYYVKYPVPTNIVRIGVKDVKLLTENAVAILVREYLRINGESDSLVNILEALNVEKP